METINAELAGTGVIERLHLGRFDVVINRNAEVGELTDLVLPDLRNDPEESLSKWVKVEFPSYPKDRFRIDRSRRPWFFAKKKWMDREFWEMYKRELLFQKPGVISDRQKQALNSLLNEFQIYSKVKAIVTSYEVSEVAAKYGYVGVKFAEPLLGFIDRRKKQKTAIYRYVEGDRSLRPPAKNAVADDFIADLMKIFEAHGIEPYDLDSRQFIQSRDPQPILTLVDIEGFHNVPKEKQS